MSVQPAIFADAATAAAECAGFIASRLEAAIRNQPFASLAISGGSSPKLLFDHLAKQPLDWSKIRLFWVDERCVPIDDDQSNYRMARERLIEPAKTPAASVTRVRTELTPVEAASRYEHDIIETLGDDPVFDIIHLGMGPDAHTASLFPGQPLIEDRARIAAAVYVDKFSQWRVTLLPRVLLAARTVVVFAPGDDKAEAMQHVFGEIVDPARYPAQLAAKLAPSTAWFADRGAARLLDS